MSNFQLFIASFTQPKQLIAGAKKKGWHVFLYFLLLVIFLSIPDILATIKNTQALYQEVQAIEQKLPDFSIKDQQLSVKEKNTGFVYQTNAFVFTFDPDQKSSLDAIQKNLIGDQIGFAMLPKQFVMVVPDESIYSSILPNNHVALSYASFDGMHYSKQNHTQLNQMMEKTFYYVLIFASITFLLVHLLYTFIYLVMITLIANLYNRSLNQSMTFGQTLKVLIYCLTVPLLILAIVSCFLPTLGLEWIMYPVALVYYIRAARQTPEKL